MKNINVVFNSLLAFIGAYLATILLHELAHFIMAIGLGHESTLYHNRVNTHYKNNKNLDPILVASAGPIFSLIQGIIFLQWSRIMKKGVKALFALWMGLAGLISFFGYIMIAPIIKVGDTGFVFDKLGFPMWLQIVIAIIGIVAITLILMRTAKDFEQFVDQGKIEEEPNRMSWANALILFPLLIGVVIISLLQLPIPHFISILATSCAPMSMMAVYGTFLGSKNKIERSPSASSIRTQYSFLLLMGVLLIIAANRLLVMGWQW